MGLDVELDPVLLKKGAGVQLVAGGIEELPVGKIAQQLGLGKKGDGKRAGCGKFRSPIGLVAGEASGHQMLWVKLVRCQGKLQKAGMERIVAVAEKEKAA